MDIHSVENLVELASSSSALLSELNKSGSFEDMNNNQSSTNLSTRMESFIKSLSNANLLKHGLDSSLAFGSLLNATSSSSLFDEGMCWVSHAIARNDSLSWNSLHLFFPLLQRK
jgi:hypothetical protein